MQLLCKVTFDARGFEINKNNVASLVSRVMTDFKVAEFRITRQEVVAFVLADNDAEAKKSAIDSWWNHGEPETT